MYVIIHDHELWREGIERNEVAGKYFICGKPVVQGEADGNIFLICKVADENGACNFGWGG